MKAEALALATGNPAKAAALKRVAAVCGVRCALRVKTAAREAGPTLADNAREKALAASRTVPGALTLASDGGVEIPALGQRWDPLRTNRFVEGDPWVKAHALLELMSGLAGDARTAAWTEALSVALDGRSLASWTVRGPACFVARRVPAHVGALWVDALLERCRPGPDHWRQLAERFARWWNE
jgi:inosine/xanthosine triphosphate pyrophosphatase family protein